MPTHWHPTKAGLCSGQLGVSFPLPVEADKAETLIILKMPASMMRSSSNRRGARGEPRAGVPGVGASHAASTGARGRTLGAPLLPVAPARGAQVLPLVRLCDLGGEKGAPCFRAAAGLLGAGEGAGAAHAFLPSSQAVKLRLLAPPKTSTAWSSHWITLPWRWEVQLAKPRISVGASMWSHTLNCASSPTKACVASKRPPSVSWEKAEAVMGPGKGTRIQRANRARGRGRSLERSGVR